ncbi:MAG: 6-carboxytetrahydropterin synthase QueD [Pseudomonadota bacterium]
MLLRNRYEFSAAHHLERHDGACRRLHGHNYTVEVTVQGPIDDHSGMVMDFAVLDRIVREQALDHLDHRDLNELIEIPTAENIARWVWARLAPTLGGLFEIRVYEIPTSAVIYRGEHES